MNDPFFVVGVAEVVALKDGPVCGLQLPVVVVKVAWSFEIGHIRCYNNVILSMRITEQRPLH